MQGLILAGVSSASAIEEVESDHYIVLSVDWVPVGSVRPLYWRKIDPQGGDIEVKIDPVNGRIIGVTVIDAPVLLATSNLRFSDRSVERGSVHVELDSWCLNPDLTPQVDLVRMAGELGYVETEDMRYFRIESEAPMRVVFQRRVGLAIGPSGLLVGIMHDISEDLS